ncbi:MAG TPA: adenylate/guanylate cyclase domain-containing protein [Gaiellales bacterium]
MGARDDGGEPAAGAHVRKTVTIVFADLASSTALGERLDPETFHVVIGRYGDEMRRVVELHGGRVEKFIGDAVMAVFGVPVLHEDDALRGVRAALEMRSALETLNRALEPEFGVELAVRIGVHTGEVIASAGATDQGLVAGDAVNAAARLQAAAPTGTILIGPETQRLVADAVRLRRHGDLELRGKTGRMRTWRVEGLAPGRASLRIAADGGMVGRRRELTRLHRRFEQSVTTGRCVVTTVVGPAGIGKSRLARQFVSEVGDRARLVVGRSLPYGEGITYWPLREIVDDLGGVAALDRLMAGDEQDELAAAMVAGAIGRSPSAASAQDVQWAVRRFLERLARPLPLVVAFDDIQWAEPPLLDLIQYLAEYVTSARVAVVCLARDDLFDRRPGWDTAFGRGATVRLRPLSDTDSARLLRGLARRRGAAVRRYEILAAAEGNPLFLEHLVAMRAADPAGATPPTIQALLAARVDGLPPAPRRVIEAAAVEGRGFHRAVLAAQLADQPDVDVDAALAELERLELVGPADGAFAGDRGYRFTHLLVRDAAYELIPKRRRAQLHVGFAEWLRAAAAGRPELDEIVGYHLEQAYGYRRQLGRVDASPHQALALDASQRLSAAGRRVLAAGDHAAAANLLRRAAALRPLEDPGRTALMIDLGGVLRDEGRFDEAHAALGEAMRLADGRADTPLRARAQVERLLAQLQVDPEGTARQAARHGGRLSRALDDVGDHAGLARLWHLRGMLAWVQAQAGDAAECWRRAAVDAAIAGDERALADVLGWEASALTHGPTPVPEASARCGEIIARLHANPWAAALAQRDAAALHAMAGDTERAAVLLDEANAVLAGFSPTVDAAVSAPEILIATLASDPARAERHLRAGRRQLDAMGERAVLAWVEAKLGLVVLAQGRSAEADRLARRAARLTTEDDTSTHVHWRRVRAVVLAERGRAQAAERMAREAVALAERTDYLNDHAAALEDLAHVLDLACDAPAARLARVAALDVYRRKGNVVSAVRLERMVTNAAPA